MSQTTVSEESKRPWWSYGHLWLVLSGPLIVVVASFITFYLAANGQDPVLTQSSGEGKSTTAEALTTLAPAVQARNHAATGTLPSTAPQNKP
jgi:hypothetical protein